MSETLSITGGFVYIENVPVEEDGKRNILIDEVLPLLYAFDGKQVTIRVDIAEPTAE